MGCVLLVILHRFGTLGDYMMVTPGVNEFVERTIAMVPIRIAVVVTLRELQPLAGQTMKLVRSLLLLYE